MIKRAGKSSRLHLTDAELIEFNNYWKTNKEIQMGEAKRRKKLARNFGQNYPASEENWVFTSASEHMAIGNLKYK